MSTTWRSAVVGRSIDELRPEDIELIKAIQDDPELKEKIRAILKCGEQQSASPHRQLA